MSEYEPLPLYQKTEAITPCEIVVKMGHNQAIVTITTALREQKITLLASGIPAPTERGPRRRWWQRLAGPDRRPTPPFGEATWGDTLVLHGMSDVVLDRQMDLPPTIIPPDPTPDTRP